MTALLIGYARVSTDEQDLTAQRDGLASLGVATARIYVDHGLTGTNRERPGLREAMAACRDGDTLVVTKLDRLARSLPDAREIIDDLARRQVNLSLGGSLRNPTDPVGRLLFNVLAMVAEFESDLIRLRTREGMKVAKAKGRLRGKQPKLNPPGSPSGRSAQCGRAQHRRTRRPVRRRPLYRLPRHPTRRSESRQDQGGSKAEPVDDRRAGRRLSKMRDSRQKRMFVCRLPFWNGWIGERVAERAAVAEAVHRDWRAGRGEDRAAACPTRAPLVGGGGGRDRRRRLAAGRRAQRAMV